MEKDDRIRTYILITAIILGFLFLLARLWTLQIVDGEKYAEQSVLKAVRTVREHNFRGNIYDRNGELLAYNRLVYTVTLTDVDIYENERQHHLALNGMIYQISKTLARNGEQMIHDLKIAAGENGSYMYTVKGNALDRFKADVFGKTDPDEMTEEQKAMSADDMVRFLAGNGRYALYGTGESDYSSQERSTYGLPENYTQEEILDILGIRYMLSFHAYQKYVPIVIARDVSEETVAFMLENSEKLAGADIGQDWERVYNGGEAFSHILGYVGKISEEELSEFEDSDKGYTMDSIVGKAGLEQYLEKDLQGTDGKRQIYVDNMGRVLGEGAVIQEMVNGKDISLTVDKDLQIAVYDFLEQKLAEILSENLINAKNFDKTNIADTTDIRIPVYDVYIALFENGVIRTGEFYDAEASELEKRMAGIWEKKQEEVLGAIRIELEGEGTSYRMLSPEMQDYVSYIEESCSYLDVTAADQDDVYREWKSGGEISLREYLFYAAQNGWIKTEDMDLKDKYNTADEIYHVLSEQILEDLKNDDTFCKKMFRYLILEGRITNMEICGLLYEQEIFPERDEDYERLTNGSMDAFEFIQKKIQTREITPAQLALDPCSASAVVVETGTGNVLACVSYPGYDNNRLANQVDDEYYGSLLNDRSLPLYNRATQQLTAPGSVFKPLTIIAGIQEGVIQADTEVFCDGVFDKVEPSLRCWKHSGHGEVANAPTALQFSCNDYLCEISYRLGMQQGGSFDDGQALHCLRKYAEMFHLNETSGIEIYESVPHMTDAYGIPSAIGQGTHNYTTTQLARYINAVASRGDGSPLTLIENTEGEENWHIDLPDPVWDTVQTGMQQFAQENAVLKDMEINVAGKTGTAQESKYRPDHALFAGYAPAEAPEITIAVRIANGYASSNATMAGRNIFNYYFGLE